MKNTFVALLIFSTLFASAQNFKETEIKKHISFLASDKLKGRGTSAPEELEAARYIAAQFKQAGLSAFNSSYLKPFTFKKNLDPHDTSLVGIKDRSSNNVVGFLDNKAPYTIVIG